MAIAELVVNLVANTGNFTKNINKAARDLDKTGRQLESAGKSIMSLTAPLAGLGIAAFKMSSDFNKSMAAVEVMISRVATEGGLSIQELKKEVLDLSNQTGIAANELSQGLFQVISTFGNTADAASQLEVAAKAALAGGATVAETVALLGVVSKNFGDSSAEAQQKIVDLAFVTNELGVTTFQELAQSMTLVAPVAASIGVSMDELFASYSALTGVTGNTSVVSTQFRAALVALQKPTEDMTKILMSLGYQTGEQLLKEKGLLGAFQAVTAESAAKNINLGKALSSVEALSFVTALTTTQTEKFTQAMIANTGATGTGAKAYETYTQGLGASDVKMNQIIQTSKNMMIQFGDELAPVILDVLNNAIIPLMNSVQDLVKAFSGLDPETKKMIIQITAWAGAIGATLFVVGKFMTALAGLHKLKVLLIPAIGLLKVAVAGLAKAGFLLLLNPVGLTITAIAALAGGIVYFRKEIGEGLKAVKAFATELGSKFLSAVQKAFEGLSNFFTDGKIVKAVEKMMDGIWQSITSGFNKITSFVSGATDKVTGYFNDMYIAVVGNSIVPDMVDEVLVEFDRMGDGMITGTDGTITGVVSSFDNLSSSINNVFNEILGDSSEFANELGRVLHPQGFGGLISDFIGPIEGLQLDAGGLLGAFQGARPEGMIGPLMESGSFSAGGIIAGITAAGPAIGAALAPIIAQGTITGIQSAFKGDDLSFTEEAALALPTFGLSFAFDEIKSIFGSGTKNLGTIARRQFESAFNQMIDGKNIRIFDENGVLQEVDRIAMGSKDRFNKPWAEAFFELTGDAQSAFLGVGYAMQNMLGITEDIGGQIGAILADNLGGSLTNLALLLIGMEIPITDMEAAMVQAFNEGSISAHDFSVYMQGINQAYAEAEAAQNDLGLAIQLWLGTNGQGEQAVRSFQGVITAAMNQGINTIEGFIQHAIQSGMITAAQGDQLMRAFAAHGITSMDQIANASDATFIHIMGSLESMEREGENSFFGLSEQMVENFDTIEKRWERIRKLPPAELEMKIKVTGDKAPIEIAPEGSKGGSFKIPAMDTGGIVTSPTLALIGEKRSEAVIPLQELPSMMKNMFDSTVSAGRDMAKNVFNIDARGAQRGVADEIKRALLDFGDVRNGLLGTT